MSSSDNSSPTSTSLPEDASRLFQVARPHLGNMLRHAGVDSQDHDDLLQETYVGFLTFLQSPDTEVDTSRTLLPVLIDIMKKRISDYRNRNRWRSQSAGGTDAQRQMAAVEEPKKRDTIAEALSTWDRNPQLEQKVWDRLQQLLSADEYYILRRRHTQTPPTLQALADELNMSIGKLHKLEASAKQMFQSEFERQMIAELDSPREP